MVAVLGAWVAVTVEVERPVETVETWVVLVAT